MRNEQGKFITRGGQVARNCQNCSKSFTVYRCRLKRKNGGKYCSVSCSSLFGWKTGNLKGIPRSTETRIKIGLNTPKYSGEKHWNYKGGIWKDENHRNKIHYIAGRRHLIKKRGNGGSYTLEEWEKLKKFYGYMCLCCKKEEPYIKLEADHIMPLSKGGLNFISNIQPLCRSCNAKKHTKIIRYELIEKS